MKRVYYHTILISIPPVHFATPPVSICLWFGAKNWCWIYCFLSLTEKAKGHSGSLPNLNRSCTAQQQQQQNSNSHQSGKTTTDNNHQSPAEPTTRRQPGSNGVTVKRSPTNPGSKSSGLRQPSPTKLRASSPSRSGIPVRLGLGGDRSAIPRPRSAIMTSRGQIMHSTSTLPRAWVLSLFCLTTFGYVTQIRLLYGIKSKKAVIIIVAGKVFKVDHAALFEISVSRLRDL